MEKRQQRGLFTVPGLLLAFCSHVKKKVQKEPLIVFKCMAMLSKKTPPCQGRGFFFHLYSSSMPWVMPAAVTNSSSTMWSRFSFGSLDRTDWVDR